MPYIPQGEIFKEMNGSRVRKETGDDIGSKQLKVGGEYEVTVSEIDRKGDGIARIQRFVIFVKNGKVGEKTKIRILSVEGKSARAELVK
jgi:predicted RNA-binding protein with TRAM domain